MTVGWAGGDSHLVDMCYVQDPLRAVLDRHPEVDMHFTGRDFSPLLHRECLWTGWHGDIWDYYKAIDFDIGLAPLADIPFNYSKSHLKALDYAARGVPVIAQDLPPYRDFVVDGVTGYLVRSHAEWEKRLEELIGDAGARAEMGAAALELAAKWTIQEHWGMWERRMRRRPVMAYEVMQVVTQPFHGADGIEVLYSAGRHGPGGEDLPDGLRTVLSVG